MTQEIVKTASVPRVRERSALNSSEHERSLNPVGALQRATSAHASSLRPLDILTLQRTVGNRAVQRLLSSRLSMSSTSTQTIQRQTEEEEPVQGKFETGLNSVSSFPSTLAQTIQPQTEDEEPLQGKSEASPRSENKTGLPDRLKAGIENLSGLSMDDVRVHYNSTKPAEVQALAYTQGAEIHVAPGQENHLAHEAWHVVQQKQGRVKPTLQAKELKLNLDRRLEAEADTMGAEAAGGGDLHPLRKKGWDPKGDTGQPSIKITQPPVIQMTKWVDEPAGRTARSQLSPQLLAGLNLAIANPRHDLPPPNPQWVIDRTIIVYERNQRAVFRAAAQDDWTNLVEKVKVSFRYQNKVPTPALILAEIRKRRKDDTLDEAKFIDSEEAKRFDVWSTKMAWEVYDKEWKEKWGAVWNNDDGDLPGQKGAGGYQEFYAPASGSNPFPSDAGGEGIFGKNRILHKFTPDGGHDNSWWASPDHYNTFYLITNL